MTCSEDKEAERAQVMSAARSGSTAVLFSLPALPGLIMLSCPI